MKTALLTFLCVFFAGFVWAQPPRLELQPQGFEPVEVPFPPSQHEKLIALTQNWAAEFNRREEGFVATNITDNTITITANKENAFYYRERGEAYDFKVRYEMRIKFNDGSYSVHFVVTEIYSDNKRIEYTLPDYFNSQGKLKEGYEEIERSIEATANSIIESHYNYLLNFRS